jgi:hypothetical protein
MVIATIVMVIPAIVMATTATASVRAATSVAAPRARLFKGEQRLRKTECYDGRYRSAAVAARGTCATHRARRSERYAGARVRIMIGYAAEADAVIRRPMASISGPFRWVLSARPQHPRYTRIVAGERVTYAVPRLDREQRRAHLRYVARFSLVFSLLLTALAASAVTLRPSQDRPTALLTMLGGLCLGAASQFVRVWLVGAIDVSITVDRDRLSYQFKSPLFSRARQWAREDVTAVRWTGYKTIRVVGKRGETIGRIVVPTLPESWMASLSRDVRIEFGF